MEEILPILYEQLQLLGFGISIAFITSFIAWKLGFYRFLPQQTLKSLPLSFKYCLVAFSLFFFIEIFLMPLFSFFLISFKTHEINDHLNLLLDSSINNWLNLITIWMVTFGLLSYFLFLSSEVRKKIWGNHSKGFSRFCFDFLLGCSTWFIAFPLVVVLSQIFSIILLVFFQTSHIEQVAVQSLRSTKSFPILFWMTIASLISFVPIVEELLFRGFLQSWLKGKFGRRYAITLSAFIFAIFHFSTFQGINNIEFISSLFLLGLFLGFLYERQGSLWAPIGLHAMFNFMSILMIVQE